MEPMVMIKRITLFVFFNFFIINVYGAIKTDTLYINAGNFNVGHTSFPYSSFNSGLTFRMNCKVMKYNTGDILNLTVINNTTKAHNFQIKEYQVDNAQILAGSKKDYTITLEKEGVFIYYDGLKFPDNYSFGLSGMLIVEPSNNFKKFYWNLKEHDSLFNAAYANGVSPDYHSYNPLYYTINTKSYPNTLLDPTASIFGKKGEVIRIYVANTGLMGHSLYFHGYHAKIIHDSKRFPGRTGWIKDTFYIEPHETMIIEFIPDKPGTFLVNDANYIANTENGECTSGMMLMIQIY